MTRNLATDIVLLGASVRALAGSVLRAGLTPWCVDLFGDVDLTQRCPTRSVPLGDYPEGFLATLANAPDVPWMYTGGLENAPTLVDAIPRPLWGIGGEGLRAVRDPWRLQLLGLPVPRLLRDVAAIGPSCAWLAKPLRSSGGLEIHRWQAGAAFDASRHYLQEMRAGTECSAVYVGRSDGTVRLIGASRQIVGADWLHARRFVYAGSVGPMSLDAAVEAEVRRWGEVLVAELGLRGLFGCDFLLEGDKAWLLEVNPRYTASVEILERATGEALVAEHVRGFGGMVDEFIPTRRVSEGEPSCGASPSLTRRVGETTSAVQQGGTCSAQNVPGHAAIHGKGVLFAREDLRFPDAGPWLESLQMPLESLDLAYADVPAAGSLIERGRPVLTMFATGGSHSECEARLREMAWDLDRRLWGR